MYSERKMSILLTGVRLKKRGFLAAMIPYFPFFTWYYVFSYYLLKFIADGSTESFLIFNAIFNFIISLALILGSYLFHRVKKTSIIYAWSIFSSIGTILITIAPIHVFGLVIFLLLGAVFGISLLAFFTYFWELTVPEERGRVAGLIGFIFLPIFPLVVILANSLDFFSTAILCIILNLVILSIKPLNPEKISALTTKKGVKEFNPEKREILFYLIPWLIYSLVNNTFSQTISFHISQYFSSSSLILVFIILQDIGGCLGAITGGIIADFFGRRLSLAFGLTLYGISSAISGLSKSFEMFYLAFFGTGLTWGIFLILYSFEIWGDLANLETCAQRYLIGLATYYSTAGIGILISPKIIQIPLVLASITSCLLIFLSNIPLILAPELLPENFREKIRVEVYLRLVRGRK